MNFPEKIKGQKITLECAVATFDLADELFALVESSRESLLPWLPWALKNKTPEDEFEYLLNWCEKHRKDGVGVTYVIREKTTNRAVGVIDLMNISANDKSGEIGYWLGAEFVGNGYMHEAIKLFEDEIFAQGFNRIEIRNDTRNIRSVNVTKRAGYHLEGALRQNRWSEVESCFTSMNVWSKIRDDLKK